MVVTGVVVGRGVVVGGVVVAGGAVVVTGVVVAVGGRRRWWSSERRIPVRCDRRPGRRRRTVWSSTSRRHWPRCSGGRRPLPMVVVDRSSLPRPAGPEFPVVVGCAGRRSVSGVVAPGSSTPTTTCSSRRCRRSRRGGHSGRGRCGRTGCWPRPTRRERWHLVCRSWSIAPGAVMAGTLWHAGPHRSSVVVGDAARRRGPGDRRRRCGRHCRRRHVRGGRVVLAVVTAAVLVVVVVVAGGGRRGRRVAGERHRGGHPTAEHDGGGDGDHDTGLEHGELLSGAPAAQPDSWTGCSCPYIAPRRRLLHPNLDSVSGSTTPDVAFPDTKP